MDFVDNVTKDKGCESEYKVIIDDMVKIYQEKFNKSLGPIYTNDNNTHGYYIVKVNSSP